MGAGAPEPLGTATNPNPCPASVLLPARPPHALQVRKWLRHYPFQFDDARDVKILSGVDEGAFAWLTLNYLLGNLGKAEDSTVASIDLGAWHTNWCIRRLPSHSRSCCPGFC